MALTMLDQSNFISTIESSSIPVLVMFGAPWCGPCKPLKIIVEQLAGESPGAFLAVYVDSEESPDLASSEGIRAFPTLIVYKDGKETARKAGLIPKVQVLNLLA